MEVGEVGRINSSGTEFRQERELGGRGLRKNGCLNTEPYMW